MLPSSRERVRNRYSVNSVSMVSNNGLHSVIQSMNTSSGVTCTVWFVYVWRYTGLGYLWMIPSRHSLLPFAHDTRVLMAFMSMCGPESDF